MAHNPDTLLPNNHRWLVTIQIPGTSSPRVVEVTAPSRQGVAELLARSDLKYITQPIDLGPAPVSDASLVAHHDATTRAIELALASNATSTKKAVESNRLVVGQFEIGA